MRRKKRKTRRKLPHLPTPVYVKAGDDFDIMGLYAVRIYDESECPSQMWFRLRASLNKYVIAQHSIEGVRVIVRLK